MLLVTLSGGSSFPDVLGQVIVRTGSMLLLAVAIVTGQRFNFAAYKVLSWLIAAVIVVVAIQLVPLPPALWRMLPGRGMFDISASLPEAAEMWRPAAIVPDAARNALLSLVVPACAFLLISAVPRSQLPLAVPLLVALVGLSSIVAALQFAGGGFDNPLINESVGFASGLFSNRNHQALFLAIGIVAAMQWGATRPFVPIRTIAATGSVVWFTLMVLATGSRAGLMLGTVALVGGGVLVFSAIRRARIRIAPRTAILVTTFAVLGLATIVFASFYAGRSESIDRLNNAVIGEDMRVRAVPVVLDIVRSYMPIGAGQGSFATLFKVAEPDSLLKPTYFNHAHDDFLELLIEAGIPGAMLLVACLTWLTRCSWQTWRLPASAEVQRARLATIIFLLVLLASIVDYPARTPLIMTVVVLAAAWLTLDRLCASPALPGDGPTLYRAPSLGTQATGDPTFNA